MLERYKRIKEDPGFIRSDEGALALFTAIKLNKNVKEAFLSLGFHMTVEQPERKSKFSDDVILKAINMRTEGKKWKDIGEELNVNHASIRHAAQKYMNREGDK